MGCGSSQSLTVPTGSSDYKYMVQRTWEKVDNTLDSKKKSKVVVTRSGWKTVRVFVSSTFKDFHAEREVLVKEVKSTSQECLWVKGCAFQVLTESFVIAIDLQHMQVKCC